MRREPALIIGFICTVASELAVAFVSLPAGSKAMAYILAATPVVSAAVIRTFVSPTDKPGL